MSDLFDAQTKDQIESRMVQTLHTLTDTDKTAIEGSFARDMIDANAVEFENSYAEMAMLRDAAFAETAWGEYLTLRAEEFGIQRKQAVKANGQVTVTGQSGAYIIRGSLFQTKDGLRFYTTESATIPSDGTEADIAVQAADTGVKGNVAPGTMMRKPMRPFWHGSCSGSASPSHPAMPTTTAPGPCPWTGWATARSSRSGTGTVR